MKLIIEIPEEVYEKQRYSQYFGAWSVVLQKCFENGTPLEKHDEEVIKETVASIWGKPPYTEVLDKIRAEIQNLRNCSCSCSDGIIDEVEDIIDKYRKGQTNADSD